VNQGTGFKLADALRDRYVIERELGRGGMATVYLARDLKHDRPVALKVLHPELAKALGPDRFLREIKLAARLQHPHILSVHDSGQTDTGAGEGTPLLWFTMPYVEGESLRERLAREQQLPVEDALRITREAALALDYAHRHGVIHRDIKPENILLCDGQALVADFGIGRALGMAEPGERLTETGVVIGTPAYMSPEQATGERELDGRTDIYSLGVVLYEMLTGEPLYVGRTAQAIMAKRFAGEVPSIRRVRPAVPKMVEQAVLQALAPVPADRFPTAAEFTRALSAASAVPVDRVASNPPLSTLAPHTGPSTASIAARPIWRSPAALASVLGLLVIVGLGMFLWLRSYRAPGESGTGNKRLAVLPFESLGAPGNEYFADGITDAVRGKLTAMQGLQVVARSSSSQYKQTAKTPQQIGRELGVEYLLTGTVRWEEGEGGPSRVQVSPELIDVADATAEWQQPFYAPLTDVFQVQADIAGRVAEALGVALGTGERQALAERPTANIAAYDAYLKGEEISGALSKADPVALPRAMTYYERAVALDSAFALAWVQLSRANSQLYFSGSGSNTADRALEGAQRALALAPERPEPYLALGDYHANVSREYAKALEQYGRGRRLAPASADLLTATALAERSLGRWESALEHLNQAQRLDPRSVSAARRFAFALLYLRRYPEALTAYDRALALDPGDVAALQQRAMIFLAQADLPRARAVLRAAPRDVEPEALVAYVAGYGDLVWLLDEEQQALLLRLTPGAFRDNRGAWGLALAQAHTLRGDRGLARAYADSARVDFEAQLRDRRGDVEMRIFRAVALTYLGRRAEAVLEGERSVAAWPISKDAHIGAYFQHLLARIYILAGEPDKALDRLEPLLKMPYWLSPGFLRIDPTFDPLRGNPRFERLVKGT
jgi:serine/threonine protein kinase/tetratricopeptide (TPR) repeat protein